MSDQLKDAANTLAFRLRRGDAEPADAETIEKLVARIVQHEQDAARAIKLIAQGRYHAARSVLQTPTSTS